MNEPAFFDLRLNLWIITGLAFVGPIGMIGFDALVERAIARGWLRRYATGPGAAISLKDYKFMAAFVVVTGIFATAGQMLLFSGGTYQLDLGVRPLEMILFTTFLLLLVDTNGFFWHRFSHKNGAAYRRFHDGHHRTGGNIRAAVAFHASTIWDYPLHSGLALSAALSLLVVATGHYPVVTITYAITIYVIGLAAMHSGVRETPLVRWVLNIALLPMRIVPSAIRVEDHARHHARGAVNYAVFFSHWDRLFGSWDPAIAPSKKTGS
jgi:sterol desaturase/sphingolipid hydroxylase (fatty acid hydroxylase superfamily)